MQLLVTLLVILAAVLIGYGLFYLYIYIIRKKSADFIAADDMRKDLRRVQLIDVREQPEFDANHILGARNIPASQFKHRFSEIRRDQKIYLYDETTVSAARAANILRKNGYQEIYILDGGIEAWDGRTKSNI